MAWQVFFTAHAAKQVKKLPENITVIIRALVREIEVLGPLRYNWRHFGKLRGEANLYHCHVKHGKPVYVVCWRIKDKKIKIVEVCYVGTHENAGY